MEVITGHGLGNKRVLLDQLCSSYNDVTLSVKDAEKLNNGEAIHK